MLQLDCILQFGHGWAAVENGNMETPADSNYFLQFGHGWAAVENTDSVMVTEEGYRLQFGHGWAAVENGAEARGPLHRLGPSIRPRLGGRGEHRRFRRCGQHGHPSIRPRLGGRGEQAFRPHDLAAAFTFNSATAGRPWRTSRLFR